MQVSAKPLTVKKVLESLLKYQSPCRIAEFNARSADAIASNSNEHQHLACVGAVADNIYRCVQKEVGKVVDTNSDALPPPPPPARTDESKENTLAEFRARNVSGEKGSAIIALSKELQAHFEAGVELDSVFARLRECIFATSVAAEASSNARFACDQAALVELCIRILESPSEHLHLETLRFLAELARQALEQVVDILLGVQFHLVLRDLLAASTTTAETEDLAILVLSRIAYTPLGANRVVYDLLDFIVRSCIKGNAVAMKAMLRCMKDSDSVAMLKQRELKGQLWRQMVKEATAMS